MFHLPVLGSDAQRKSLAERPRHWLALLVPSCVPCARDTTSLSLFPVLNRRWALCTTWQCLALMKKAWKVLRTVPGATSALPRCELLLPHAGWQPLSQSLRPAYQQDLRITPSCDEALVWNQTPVRGSCLWDILPPAHRPAVPPSLWSFWTRLESRRNPI